MAALIGMTSSIVMASSASGAVSAEVAALRERLPDAALVHSQVTADGVKATRYQFDGLRAQNQRKTWKPSKDEQASIDKHVAAQMRAGKNISADSVDVIAFEAPGKMIFHLVQGKNDKLEKFAVELYEKDGHVGSGAAFKAIYTDDAKALTGADAGFDGGIGNNATNRNTCSNCTRTVYFTPNYSYSGNKHWVTQSWEKWQSNSQWNQWAYNSYATFDPANAATGYVAHMVDSTIRARPWNKNANGYVTGGPYDYEPRPQEVCQTLADVGINVGSYASLTIPLTNCYSGQEIYPEGNQHMMGTAVYGSTTSQRYLDFSFAFTTCCSPVIPSMSDYIWMAVDWCNTWSPDCGWHWGYNRENWKWTDGGW